MQCSCADAADVLSAARSGIKDLNISCMAAACTPRDVRIHASGSVKIDASSASAFRVRCTYTGREGAVHCVAPDIDGASTTLAIKIPLSEDARSLDATEMDLTALLWFALARTGTCLHVVRFYSAPVVTLDMPKRVVTGLAMEALDAFHAKTLAELWRATLLRCGGGIDKDVDDKDKDKDDDMAFRAVLFQTIYALVSTMMLLNNSLRFNDLHAANVGVTLWRSDGASFACGYEVLLPLADGSFSARHFVIRTALRAVLLDFGKAALTGPALSARADIRFAAVEGATGMSAEQPSKYYDVALLLYSLFAMSSAADVRTSAAARDFAAFYTRVTGGTWHRSDSGMCCSLLAAAGRLNMPTQVALTRQRQGFLTPLEMLRDPYFAQFRAADVSAAQIIQSVRGDVANCGVSCGALPRATRAYHTDRAEKQLTEWYLRFQGAATQPCKPYDAALSAWLGDCPHWLWCARCKRPICAT